MNLFSRLSRAYHAVRSRFGEPFNVTVYYHEKEPRKWHMNRLAWESWRPPVIGTKDEYGTVTGYSKGYSP